MKLIEKANDGMTSSEEETLEMLLKRHFPDCKIIKEDLTLP